MVTTNNLNQVSAENEDDFLHRLATKVKKLTTRHAAVIFESVHVKPADLPVLYGGYLPRPSGALYKNFARVRIWGQRSKVKVTWHKKKKNC